MRFTHRWDHHLQGDLVDEETLNRSRESWSQPWPQRNASARKKTRVRKKPSVHNATRASRVSRHGQSLDAHLVKGKEPTGISKNTSSPPYLVNKNRSGQVGAQEGRAGAGTSRRRLVSAGHLDNSDRRRQAKRRDWKATRRLSMVSDISIKTPRGQPKLGQSGEVHVGLRDGRKKRSQPRKNSVKPMPRLVAAVAYERLLDMVHRPNVLLAASNAYDAMYLGRSFGIRAVPWPGISAQLAALEYTGNRKEVLFCCGNGPYNKAIEAVSRSIVQASVSESRGLSFAWLREIYRKYAYSDLASHPLAVLLPYSMHSYGAVQTYALGVPLLAPALPLLSMLHYKLGICGHKSPGNVPWRRSADRARVPFDDWRGRLQTKEWFAPRPSEGGPCCAHEPNDSCDPSSSAKWLQFADWYQWPNVTYFTTVEEVPTIAASLLRDVVWLIAVYV